jgi:hypothetical protein
VYSHPNHEPTSVETESLRQQVAAVRDELSRFRTDVRNEILWQHEYGSWCLDGTEQALDDLGLDPIEYTYTGQIRLTVDITVNRAANRDIATHWINNAVHTTSSDQDVVIGDWDLDVIDVERL